MVVLRRIRGAKTAVQISEPAEIKGNEDTCRPSQSNDGAVPVSETEILTGQGKQVMSTVGSGRDVTSEKKRGQKPQLCECCKAFDDQKLSPNKSKSKCLETSAALNDAGSSKKVQPKVRRTKAKVPRKSKHVSLVADVDEEVSKTALGDQKLSPNKSKYKCLETITALNDALDPGSSKKGQPKARRETKVPRQSKPVSLGADVEMDVGKTALGAKKLSPKKSKSPCLEANATINDTLDHGSSKKVQPKVRRAKAKVPRKSKCVSLVADVDVDIGKTAVGDQKLFLKQSKSPCLETSAALNDNLVPGSSTKKLQPKLRRANAKLPSKSKPVSLVADVEASGTALGDQKLSPNKSNSKCLETSATINDALDAGSSKKVQPKSRRAKSKLPSKSNCVSLVADVGVSGAALGDQKLILKISKSQCLGRSTVLNDTLDPGSSKKVQPKARNAKAKLPCKSKCESLVAEASETAFGDQKLILKISKSKCLGNNTALNDAFHPVSSKKVQPKARKTKVKGPRKRKCARNVGTVEEACDKSGQKKRRGARILKRKVLEVCEVSKLMKMEDAVGSPLTAASEAVQEPGTAKGWRREGIVNRRTPDRGKDSERTTTVHTSEDRTPGSEPRKGRINKKIENQKALEFRKEHCNAANPILAVSSEQESVFDCSIIPKRPNEEPLRERRVESANRKRIELITLDIVEEGNAADANPALSSEQGSIVECSSILVKPNGKPIRGRIVGSVNGKTTEQIALDIVEEVNAADTNPAVSIEQGSIIDCSSIPEKSNGEPLRGRIVGSVNGKRTELIALDIEDEGNAADTNPAVSIEQGSEVDCSSVPQKTNGKLLRGESVGLLNRKTVEVMALDIGEEGNAAVSIVQGSMVECSSVPQKPNGKPLRGRRVGSRNRKASVKTEIGNNHAPNGDTNSQQIKGCSGAPEKKKKERKSGSTNRASEVETEMGKEQAPIGDTNSQQGTGCSVALVKKKRGTKSGSVNRESDAKTEMRNNQAPIGDSNSQKVIGFSGTGSAPEKKRRGRKSGSLNRLSVVITENENNQAPIGDSNSQQVTDCSGALEKKKRGRPLGSLKRESVVITETRNNHTPIGDFNAQQVTECNGAPEKKKRGRKSGSLKRQSVVITETGNKQAPIGDSNAQQVTECSGAPEKKRGRKSGSLKKELVVITETGNNQTPIGNTNSQDVSGCSSVSGAPEKKKRAKKSGSVSRESTLRTETENNQTQQGIGCSSVSGAPEKKKRARKSGLMNSKSDVKTEMGNNQALVGDTNSQQVMGCSGAPEKKKRGRKSGSENRELVVITETKNLNSQEVTRCSSVNSAPEKKKRARKSESLNRESAVITETENYQTPNAQQVIGCCCAPEKKTRGRKSGSLKRKSVGITEPENDRTPNGDTNSQKVTWCSGAGGASEKRKRSRKSGSLSRESVVIPETENTQASNDDTNIQPVMGCIGVNGAPEKKKRARKSGSLNRKSVVENEIGNNQAPVGDTNSQQVTGCSGVGEKKKRVRKLETTNRKSTVRTKRGIRQAPDINSQQVTGCSGKSSAPEKKNRRRKQGCLNRKPMERFQSLSSLQGGRNVHPELTFKEDIPNMPECHPISLTRDEQVNELKEKKNGLNVCSSMSCATPNLPNAGIRLQNSNDLIELQDKSMTSPTGSDPQQLVFINDTNQKDTQSEVATKSNTLNSTKQLKVKLNFRKRPPSTDTPISPSYSDIHCSRAKKPKGLHCRGNHVEIAKSSVPDHCQQYNNNTVDLDLINEILTQNTCNLWDNWRASTLHVSEEESDGLCTPNCSPIYVSPDLNSCLFDDENENCSCQRVVPFTGKTVWRASCARIRIWTSNKRLNDQKTTETDTKSSLKVCFDFHSQNQLEESSSKRIKVGLFEDLPSLNCTSPMPPLKKCINPAHGTLMLEDLASLNCTSPVPAFKECINPVYSTLVTDIPFGHEEQSTEESLSLKPIIPEVSSTASIDSEQINVPDVSTPSSRPQSHNEKNHISKACQIPKLSQLIKILKPPVFSLKSYDEKCSNLNCVSELNVKETSMLTPSNVDQPLTSEICSSLALSIQKSNTGDMNDPIVSEKDTNTFNADEPLLNSTTPNPEPGTSTGDHVKDKHLNFPCKEYSSEYVNSKESVLGVVSSPENNVLATAPISDILKSYGEDVKSKELVLEIVSSPKNYVLATSPISDIRKAYTEDVNSKESGLGIVLSPEKTVLASAATSDILKAYEEDILIIDVIPDDPELFESQNGEEEMSPPSCSHNLKGNAKNVKSKRIPLIWRDPNEEGDSELDRNNNSQKEVCRPENCIAGEDHFMAENNNYCPENKHEIVSTCISPKEDYEMADDPMDIEGDDDFQQLPHMNKFDVTNQTAKPPRRGESSLTFQTSLPKKPSPLPQHPRYPLNGKNMHNSIPSQDTRQNRWETWNQKCTFNRPRLQPFVLPFGYCKNFFNTPNGCRYRPCSFIHTPRQNEEKLCMDLLRKMINENNVSILERAICVFISYFSQYPPRMNYDESVFEVLLTNSLARTWWNYVFDLLETLAAAKFPPSVDLLIKVFEQVVYMNLETSLFRLMSIFGKFLDAGMTPTPAQINHIIVTLNQLPNPRSHINFLLSMRKSMFEMQVSENTKMYDLETAFAEIEHCKVNSDWMKLGTLYLNVCTGRENITDLKNFSRCIAEALMQKCMDDRPEVPYCVFAESIFKDPQLNDMHKTVVGMIGISVLFFYYRKELWEKGRRVLSKFRDLQINFTVLKGITREDNFVTRCSVVNVALDIFLRCGRLNTAIQALKDTDWFLRSPTWPCTQMDVLKRHNLLFTIIQEALTKCMFNVCFEVLQNLPCFRESKDEFNISQYSLMFNKVLGASVANRSLAISSSIVEFMIINIIPIEYVILQELITALGHSSLWVKARDHYKCALSLGFYSQFEITTNSKILHIPSFMTEVEMLLTLERFMVSNSSLVKLPDESRQNLQVILRKHINEGDKAMHKDSYQAATERLFEASRLSSPKLFIKHTTVNHNNEQVYLLDHNSCVKWLTENRHWAENIWGRR